MSQDNDNTVFQHSTINALAEGIYHGDISFAELKRYGNFGLGTLQGLDGEMIGLEGIFYQIKSDGSINEVEDEQLTPFSVVTNFMADDELKIDTLTDYKNIQETLDQLLPSHNYIYAFRVDGVFSNLVTRSVPIQKSKIRLVDVIPNQKVFRYEGSIEGTMVGFYFPPYMRDINVVGYHFHFLSKDKTKGGHLLNLQTKKAVIQIDFIKNFKLNMPDNKDFGTTDLMKIEETELDTIEKE